MNLNLIRPKKKPVVLDCVEGQQYIIYEQQRTEIHRDFKYLINCQQQSEGLKHN